MVKRFTDSDKFNDVWYRKLSLLHKVIWEYLLSECNHAGILTNLDFELMSFKIGTEIQKSDLDVFQNKIIYLDDDILFIPNFIKFQYGLLNSENRVHKSILKEFKKYEIDGASMGLVSPLLGAKDKDKDKNKDKEKENTQILIGEYQNVCLLKKDYDKLLNLCLSEKLLNELVNSFSIAIEVGKERPYIADLPHAHYERLKAYYSFRKKYPDKFREKESSSNSRQIEVLKQIEEDAKRRMGING